MRKVNLIMVLSVILTTPGYTQEKDIDNLFKEFQSAEWNVVLQAKENLENLENNSIPKLLDMLKDNSHKKLLNTGDLIYPGADKFFGHGQIIEYDIDKLDVRAGWLLEELTFQNFGFGGIHIESQNLVNYIRFNFPKYYNNTRNRQSIDKSSENAKRELIKKLSIEAAQKWWDEAGKSWNRLDALINALGSEDEKRQAKALFYIRNGKTSCSGLTNEVYKSKFEELIVELSKSQLRRISEQAKLIILDTDFEWMKLKTSAIPQSF